MNLWLRGLFAPSFRHVFSWNGTHHNLWAVLIKYTVQFQEIIDKQNILSRTCSYMYILYTLIFCQHGLNFILFSFKLPIQSSVFRKIRNSLKMFISLNLNIQNHKLYRQGGVESCIKLLGTFSRMSLRTCRSYVSWIQSPRKETRCPAPITVPLIIWEFITDKMISSTSAITDFNWELHFLKANFKEILSPFQV